MAAPGAIVTEGYMDVIALHRAGFGGGVAPLGTALTEMQLHELVAVWRPSRCCASTATPPDSAPRCAPSTARCRCCARAAVCALPRCPPGEDPDSLIRSGGPCAFDQILAAARPLSELLWQTEAQRPARSTRRSGAPISNAG